jgi:tetratricopeptide (TPR) repeat protein
LIPGRYELSIAICNEILHQDPDNQRAFAVRGYAHLLEQDNPRQTIADFGELIRRDPGNATFYVARAKAFEQTKEYDRTIADCNEAIRLDPRNSEA